MIQLLTEFETLALAAHEFHQGEWTDCKYRFCRRRYELLMEARESLEPKEERTEAA